MKWFLILLTYLSLVHGTVFSQRKIAVNLRLIENSGKPVYHNEPLIFTTTIRNEGLQENLQWNLAADQWVEKLTADYKAGNISKEEFQNETDLITKGKRQLKADTIGTLSAPWFHQLQFYVYQNDSIQQANWPVSILGEPYTDSIAILNERGRYVVKHHLSPEQVNEIKPGTYKVKVIIQGQWSNPVSVKILPEKIPPAIASTKNMQLRLGNYYLKRMDAENAMLYASRVLKKEPASIGGLMLRGETYILKEKYKEALADFEKALKEHSKQFPNENEPPEYLLGTIEWLKEKQ